MGLGLSISSSSEGGGDFLPIVKYNASAGRWVRRDRYQDESGDWQSKNVDLTANFSAAFDVADCEVGWLKFHDGVSKVTVPMGEPLPPQTSPDHKQGFSLPVKLSADCGGDIREFSSNAKVVCAVMDALVDKVEASAEYNKEAKIPIITCTGSNGVETKTPGGMSTNYAPIFEITGWITRDQFGSQAETETVDQPVQQTAPPPPAAGAVAASQF